MTPVKWLLLPGALAVAAGAPAEEAAISLSGGVTVTALAAEGGRADPTLAGSFDLLLEVAAGPGAWVLYVEGSSSVNEGSVADRYPQANADAGTALAGERDGTVQVSELKYRWEAGEGRTFTAGVVDTSAYMDLSHTANDENSQFLHTALVNNAVIGFPDYTAGLVYEQAADDMHWFALLTSSHGLADNADRSWSQLLDVDAPGKGAFAAAGARTARGIWSLEAGVWTNGADHPRLDGTGNAESNYGAYTVIGAVRGGAAFDLRLGYANPEVSEASLFSSASLGFELGGVALGLGYARSALAEEAKGPGRDAESVAEIYLRVPLAPVDVTFDLQMLHNPGFDSSAPDTRVGGVRVHYGW